MSKRKPDHHSDAPETRPNKRIRPSILPPLPPIPASIEKYVFTHPSAAARGPDGELIHYDRLEFIGDAHLELIASNLIYDTYPTAPAGRMAQLRQQLVQNETLCQYSLMYEFDKKLNINIASSHRGKVPLTKVYGDVFEAYIGAVFRSDPTNASSIVTDWLKKLWEPMWEDLLVKFPPEVIGKKEALAKKIIVPGVRLDYVEEKQPTIHKGKGVETYYIGVYLTGWGYTNQHLGSGKAASKIKAGQEAALAAMQNEGWMDELGQRKEEWLKERESQKNKDKERLGEDKEVGGDGGVSLQ